MNTFRGRLILWLIVALFVPILIFIYDGGYNATAMGWIVGVAVLAIIVFVIKYKERFPGSATIFTFLTDGYHFCQWAFKLFLCLSFAPQIGLILAGVLWVVWGVVFSIVYRYVQR